MDKCGGNEIKSVVFQSVCWDVLLERHTNLNVFDQNTIMRWEDSRKELIISSDKITTTYNYIQSLKRF